MSTLKRLWNFWIPWVTTIVLACFSDAVGQASYQVSDLGSLHNWNLGCAMSLNNQGWTEIMAGVLDPSGSLVKGRAVVDVDGLKIDLRTLGGPNSWMKWGEINERGETVGFVETSVPDLDGEDFCGYGTTYYAALWQNGAITNLGTLPGDFNAYASGINNQARWWEAPRTPTSTGPMASIWQNGVVTDLKTLFPASSNVYATMANEINESGQNSGMATVLSGPHAGEIHAFLATPVNAGIGRSVAEVARTHPKCAIRNVWAVVSRNCSAGGTPHAS